MSMVLAAIVITVFAAIFIPPYFSPSHNSLQKSASLDSPFGFTLHLEVNSTSIQPGGAILITGWVNSTSANVENVSASNSWAFQQDRLWEKVCTSGWPIGVGVMQGHYTQDNYTLGSLMPIIQPAASCPVSIYTPPYFLFEPRSSKALVTIGGKPDLWIIQTSLAYSQYMPGYRLQPGIYTAVLADEWGDVLATNFLVT